MGDVSDRALGLHWHYVAPSFARFGVHVRHHRRMGRSDDAFRSLTLADTHAVAATSPLIVIALSVLCLGERDGLARWLAVAVGFAGVLLVVRPGFRTFD